MAILSHVQTVWAGDLAGFGPLARLEIVSGDLVIHDTGTGRLASVTPGEGLITPGMISTETLGGPGSSETLVFEGVSRTLDLGTLDRLSEAGGSLSDYLDGTGFHGHRVTLVQQEVAGHTFLHVAREAGSGIETFRVERGGGLTSLSQTPDTPGNYAATVVSMATATVGERDFLIAASQGEDGLTVFETAANGTLTAVSSFGAAEYLPVDGPAMVRTVEVGGSAFVLLASQTSSSLTALRLDADGALTFTDQVADGLSTRFAQAAAFDVTTFAGQVLAVVGGIDGGVTLWTLTPSGRLVLRDTIVDTVPAALGGISGIRFAEVGGRLEVFVLSTGEGGVARLRLDATELGQGTSAGSGSSGRDVMMADAAGGVRSGLGGDDILVDGIGRDIFIGGSGADTFVFRADGVEDEILDFNPAVDVIDLSAYPLVASVSDIVVTPTSDGAIIDLGDETLRVYSHDVTPLDLSAISGALRFDAQHVFMLGPPPVVGDADADMFVMSLAPETIDGGDGIDTVDYARLGAGILLDLADSSANGGGATGDVLTRIENVWGTALSDTIAGDGLANRIEGRGGDDTLFGRGGDDVVLPGGGSNVVDGGDGRDMVSYVDHFGGIDLDLRTGRVVHGGGADTLVAVEDAAGTNFRDRMHGDAGANALFGLAGDDIFRWSGGGDAFDGGDGIDRIDYGAAGRGVRVDLDAGTGGKGAAGDSYVSIEEVRGSRHGDTLAGGAGEEVLRGREGNDLFLGSSGGRDEFRGGPGRDTVSYARSDSGVTASLASKKGTRGDALDDSYASIEKLIGSPFKDVLRGDDGKNTLRGLEGHDRLYGLKGADVLEGGAGNDTLYGGGGTDTAVFSMKRKHYDIDVLSDGVRVRALSGSDGTDMLYDVERLNFADGDFIL